MRDATTKERDQLADKEGITPAAAQAVLNAAKPADKKTDPKTDPNHKTAT